MQNHQQNWHNNDDEEEISYEEYLAQQCPRFRILVIGKAGVGKSTLLRNVFHLTEAQAGVIHQGQGKGQHSVWRGFTSRNNPLLVIHDSGGFEAAETNNLDEVKRFIQTCSQKTQLADQLHCIWYCIDCNDARFWSEVEIQFMQFFKTSVVPLVFVLTKFDKIVAECVDERQMRGDRPGDDYMAWRTLSTTDASRRVRDQVIRPLKAIVSEDIKTAVVSVREPQLVQTLCAQTTSIVRPALRHLWISAQQVLARKKRELAIQLSIHVMSTPYVQVGTVVPLPLMKPLLHQDLFPRMFEVVRGKWNIPDLGMLDTPDTQEKFRLLCRGSQLSNFGASIVRALDPSGPLSGPHYTREYLRWAADLNIMFEILFWKHKELAEASTLGQNNQQRLNRGERMLLVADLDRSLDLYEKSEVRRKAHSLISGQVDNFDLSLPFKPKELAKILNTAVDFVTLEGKDAGFWSRTPQEFRPAQTAENLPEMAV